MRHRRVVLLVWLALLVAGLAAAGPVFGRLDQRPLGVAEHESGRGYRVLGAARSHDGQIDAVADGVRVEAPAFRAELASARRDLSTVAGVVAVIAPTTAPARGATVSADGRAALVSVQLARGLSGARRAEAERTVESRLRGIGRAVPGVRVTLGGSDLARREVAAQSVADTRLGETITLPLTLLAVCFLFGGLAAASVPLLAAIATTGTGMLWLLVLSHWYVPTSPALSATTILALALAVDYALVTVGRFRQERAAGHPVTEAVARTARTAGRTVVFAALVVTTALCGLAVFPSDFYAAIGLAAAGTVVIALAAALTLTPALLATFPNRIGARAEPGGDNGVFARLARWTRRHALPVTLGIGALLIACAAPFLRAHLVSPVGERQLPPTAEARHYADLVAERFPQHRADAIVLVAGSDPARLQSWATQFARWPQAESIGEATLVRPGVSVLRVVPVPETDDGAAERLVHRIRSARPQDFPVWVTGRNAVDIDARAEIADHAPQAAALIALTTFLVLLVMTGSVLLPLKAIAMNTLSLGAGFGALVLVFQDGWGAGLVGVHTLGGLEYWLPVVVFALAFGLSMDYEVLLLARVQEAFAQSGDNDRAVELGVQRSARIITSSAALMCLVFAGFATGELIAVKQLALALITVVVIDATLVRCLLVPATMTLLGNANWWAPQSVRHVLEKTGRHGRAAGLAADAPVPSSTSVCTTRTSSN
ncbi:MMPL family transporter [Streptomyces violascens]|uniref:MMPL family transporter n=1 Tax=Streptomyces violascens TaxID=67381 RepID=UPI0036CFFF98